MNLYTVIPTWAYKALGLTEPPLPNRLETDHLQGVLDTVQGGFGLAPTVEVISADVAQNTAAGTLILLTNTVDQCALLDVLTAEHVGGAGALNVTLRRRIEVLNTEHRIGEANIGVGAFAYLGTNFLFGHPPNGLFIPPGCGVTLRHAATGAGETLAVRGAFRRFAAGVKPI